MAGRELTTEAVAALLGVHRITVWRWITSGELPANRVGRRFRVQESEALAMRKPATVATQLTTSTGE